MENNFDNTNNAVDTATAPVEINTAANPEAATAETPVAPVQPVPAAPVQQYNQPVRKLRTNRSMILTTLLSIITFGIYGLVTFTQFSDEINVTAQKYDGQKTMNFCLLFFLVGPITFGIAYLVWFHKFSKRIGNELKRRNINYSFGAGSFWIWNTIGVIVLGPFIYLHKLCKSMNLINADYNEKG